MKTCRLADYIIHKGCVRIGETITHRWRFRDFSINWCTLLKLSSISFSLVSIAQIVTMQSLQRQSGVLNRGAPPYFSYNSSAYQQRQHENLTSLHKQNSCCLYCHPCYHKWLTSSEVMHLVCDTFLGSSRLWTQINCSLLMEPAMSGCFIHEISHSLETRSASAGFSTHIMGNCRFMCFLFSIHRSDAANWGAHLRFITTIKYVV